MKKITRYFIRDESGSTAVEFGLIALAFVALLFSIIESGRLFLAWNGFQYAVENAARAALVDDELTEADVEGLVNDQLNTFLLDPDNADLTVTFPEANNINFVQIDATYAYSVLVPMLPDSWNTFSLGAKARLARQ